MWECFRCHSNPCCCPDGITLIHDDCRRILPHLQVDTLVTDPVWPNSTAQIIGIDRPFDLFAEMCQLLPQTVKRMAVQLGCDSDPRLVACVPAWLPFFRVAFLEYVRPNYKGRLLNTGDVGYLFGTPPAARKGYEVVPGRVFDRATDKRDHRHPCPRRLTHVRWQVGRWSDLKDTICDPFAGSGTTGVACQLEGRRCVMIEIDKTHCETAADRLRQPCFAFSEP